MLWCGVSGPAAARPGSPVIRQFCENLDKSNCFEKYMLVYLLLSLSSKDFMNPDTFILSAWMFDMVTLAGWQSGNQHPSVQVRTKVTFYTVTTVQCTTCTTTDLSQSLALCNQKIRPKISVVCNWHQAGPPVYTITPGHPLKQPDHPQVPLYTQ